jgi:hypothetical protein
LTKSWHVLTWGQYTFQFVPTVAKYRWLEPRHQVNIQGRWERDKTDDLPAFFNGEGWENVWRIWNGVTPRDGEATRRAATIERGVAPLLASQDWEAFYPMRRYGVYASRWPPGNQTVWTIVNRNEYDVGGLQMTVPRANGMRYSDLYRGVELTPVMEGNDTVLDFNLESHGYGAVLAVSGEPDAQFKELMAKMAQMTANLRAAVPGGTATAAAPAMTPAVPGLSPSKSLVPPPTQPAVPCNWGPDPSDYPAPLPDRDRVMGPASDVDAHPLGAGPSGVMDMVGNVWQWMSTSMATPARQSCAAVATIGQGDPSGISRRHTKTLSTENCCQWRQATIFPGQSDSAA